MFCIVVIVVAVVVAANARTWSMPLVYLRPSINTIKNILIQTHSYPASTKKFNPQKAATYDMTPLEKSLF